MRTSSQLDSLSLKKTKLDRKTQLPNEVGKKAITADSLLAKGRARVYTKLSGFQQNGVSDLSSDQGLPSLPSVSLPGGDVENLNLPNGSMSNIKTGGVEMPQADLLGASMPGIEQPSIPSVSKPAGMGNYSEKITEITDQVKDYQKEIKDFDPGKLDEIKNTDQWEDKLSELDEVEEVKKQIDLADQAKRYYDPEVAKEEALNKAKQEAINHFAGHEEELKAAMQQLSKLKAKMPDTEGVVDLFAKRQNPLKDKPFIERVVPGLALQFQKQGSVWLDLNPTLAYKISGRFVAGLGWNERLAYDFDKASWDAKNHIYGLRSFIHFKAKENFWLKGEMEVMRSPLRATPLRGSDIVGRGLVASYFAGIKKDFQLSKTLKGNVQMIYNLYNPEKKSPYINRFNVRMGLELPLKKKPRRVNGAEPELKP
ncbi:hypothetical protein [Chryseolinea sp. H1M3-3]|uniref:hypothetical protein n=1 Tax=Chryseolinea sp. H1M3-3 TaxID=3034144 RepID=UPI0023EACD4C|nr:hypothetical protein [Chryseolinea sp. H1M3-3]